MNTLMESLPNNETVESVQVPSAADVRAAQRRVGALEALLKELKAESARRETPRVSPPPPPVYEGQIKVVTPSVTIKFGISDQEARRRLAASRRATNVARRDRALERQLAARRKQQAHFRATAFDQYAEHQKAAKKRFGWVREKTTLPGQQPNKFSLLQAVEDLRPMSLAEKLQLPAPARQIVSKSKREALCACAQCEFVRSDKKRQEAAYQRRCEGRKHRAQAAKDEAAFKRQQWRLEHPPQADITVGLGWVAWLVQQPEEGIPIAQEVDPEDSQDYDFEEETTRVRVVRRSPTEDEDWEVVLRELAHLPLLEPGSQVQHPQARPAHLLARVRGLISALAERRRGETTSEMVEMETFNVSIPEGVVTSSEEETLPIRERKLKKRKVSRFVRPDPLATTSRVYQPTTKPLDEKSLSERRMGYFRVGSKFFKPQMADEECAPTLVQTSNIVVEEVADQNEECIGHQFKGLRKYCEASTVTYPADMDRYMPIASAEWSVTNKTDEALVEMWLPFQMVYEKKDEKQNPTQISDWRLKETTMSNPLRNHQFMECDIEVTAIINASPFMQGQLQMSWLYMEEADKYKDTRLNIYGLSQTNHVIINPTEGQSGKLCIPYRHYKPYMPVRDRKLCDSPLNMGTLMIRVLSPLVAPTSSSKTVDITILGRFTRTSLMGMYPPTNASTCYKTQMMSVLGLMAATKLLNQVAPDRNRDNPPYPFSPHTMTPTASGSLAAGTNDIDQLHHMRLDAKGQTPHPYQYEDEMKVQHIVSIFGLIKRYELAATQQQGAKLFCIEASPLLDVTNYNKIVRSGTNCYNIPPVGVVSALFACWRGDLEFRLDFVATSFHQARLFFCWIPGDLETDFTYEQAQSLGGTYFDLKCGNTSVNIVVPYIADQPFWSQRYSTGLDASTQPAPSRFCCFVVNRLIYTNAVSNSVPVLVYMRGGSNFEVAQPCQPTIGLSYEPQFVNHSDKFVVARPGYFPWYVGGWREVEGGSVAILRYGPTSDHVAQFQGTEAYTYYKFADKELAKTLTFVDSRNSVISGDKVFFVPVDAQDGYGMIYMGVIRTMAQVLKYFYENSNNKWSPRPQGSFDNDQLLSIGTTTGNHYYSGDSNAIMNPTAVPLPSFSVQGNRDETPVVIKFESSSASEASTITFGERFSDLKDYCRRYSLYANVSLTNLHTGLSNVNFSFPAVPVGLMLDPAAAPIWNAARDGPIPIILSGYRFFRGGLRFKFIPYNIKNATYFVQVRQDRPYVQPRIQIKGGSVTDGLYNHGYATSCQCSSVNPILTCEIPFYMPGDAGIMSPPVAGISQQNFRFYSLGEICVILDFDKEVLVSDGGMKVLYSIADDFTAHTFQGYPAMCLIKDSQLTGPEIKSEPLISGAETNCDSDGQTSPFSELSDC